MARPYDYIVVGAGTAGCTMAARLSEDPDRRVLLLEAGPPDRSWILHMPAGLRSVFKPSNKYNWWFETEPQTHLDGRRIAQPRGKTLGGSSSINGMTWLRGHPADYDAWAHELDCTGWSYADCLPYFRRAEAVDGGDPDFRGRSGPVEVTRPGVLGDLDTAFLQAGCEAGFPETDDANGLDPDGFCCFDASVAHGLRSSAARAHLRPARGRSNLEVRTGVLVRRILVESGRAVGVELAAGSGTEQVMADREVILSAGAFASPQLLMQSGVGPADHLRAHGIPVVHDLSGVGANLQDHLEAHVQVRTDQPVSLNRELQPLRMLCAGACWAFARRGPAAVNQCRVGAFVRSHSGLERPDLQFHFCPVYFDSGWLPRADTFGYRLGVGPVRPASRGRLRLRSGEQGGFIAIDPNYLADPEDLRQMREGVRLARETLRQAAFAPYHEVETQPGPQIRSDDEINAFIRQHAASAYHPCGTCAMGPATEPEAVVDPELRLHGVSGLRVVDASVMPRLPSSNINAPTFMIAERAADLIRGRPPERDETAQRPSKSDPRR
jgi:choline dehydrogenase